MVWINNVFSPCFIIRHQEIKNAYLYPKLEKSEAVCRATNGFSHINTFNQIKKYEKTTT